MEINDATSWLRNTKKSVDFRSSGADDYYFSRADYLLQVRREESANVRDFLFNEPAIRSDETTNRDILVPDLDLTAFSQEPLDKLHRWALAQIVCPRLEAEANNTDLFAPCSQHRIHCTIQVRLVTRHD